MKLHGYNFSSLETKIQVAAQYVGLKIEDVDLDPFGASPEVLEDLKKKNPNGKVPVLETPEGYLYESNAILRYVARYNDNSTIYGKDNFERALVDQYLDWISLTLEPAAEKLLFPLYGYAPLDKAKYTQDLEALKKVLRIIDDRLKQSKYLVGDTLTIADIQLVTDLGCLYRFVFDEKFRKAFQNLNKYFEALSNEPNFLKVCGKQVFIKNALDLYSGPLE